MLQPNQKTPTKFSGIKPDSDDFEDQFNEWSKDEKIEYINYLERDTIKFNFIYGIIIGLIIGIIISFIIALVIK